MKRLKSIPLTKLLCIAFLLTAGLPVSARGQSANGVGPKNNKDYTKAVEALAAFRGAQAYDRACSSCHGRLGDGNGPASRYLDPRPRDFTAGVYKFRSTPSGHLPTDEDLYRSITFGVPRTTMPAWKNLLTEQQRRDVVAYIKNFSDRFVLDTESAPIPIPTAAKVTRQTLAEGKHLYVIMECWACHGVRGKGDGKSANSLKDNWGRKIKTFDFTDGTYKAGSDDASVYRTFNTGLNGTPMPSYADVFLFGSDKIGDISSYRETYSENEVDALKAYLQSQPTESELGDMSETQLEGIADRRKWALVHFVKSLSKKPGLFHRLFVKDYEMTQ